MTTLNNTLDKVSNYLNIPLTFTHPETQVFEDAVLFDIRELDEDSMESFLEDHVVIELLEEFEDLDLQKKVIIGGVGYSESTDPIDPANATASIRQYSYILLADIENGTDDAVPVYSIDIDGGMVPGTLKKIADDITELPIDLK
jgi:hypothetical protein